MDRAKKVEHKGIKIELVGNIGRFNWLSTNKKIIKLNKFIKYRK